MKSIGKSVQKQALESTPVSGDSLKGVYLSVERQKKHRRFVENTKPNKILLKADTAERIYQDGKGMNIMQNADQILTSTAMNDDKTELWTVKREADMLHRVEPDRHICCDRPIYESDRRNMRLKSMRDYVDDVTRLRGKVEDLNTSLIPLAKGTNKHEIDLMLEKLRGLGFNQCAVYCPQFFMQGNYFSELKSKVSNVAGKEFIDEIILLGLQSPNYLRKMPPKVVAASGQRWRRKIDIQNIHSDRKLQEWKENVEDALRDSQTRIDQWGGWNGR